MNLEGITVTLTKTYLNAKRCSGRCKRSDDWTCEHQLIDGRLVSGTSISHEPRRCARQKRHPPMSTHKSTTSTQDDLTKHSQPTTQRVGALSPMPSCLGIGGHTCGSGQGHPRYTSAHKVGGVRGCPKRTTRRPKTRGLPSSRF